MGLIAFSIILCTFALMRRSKYFLSLLGIFISLLVGAQQFSFEYGKVTKDELMMTHYDLDSTAAAVVIYKSYDLQYPFNTSKNSFSTMELQVSVKIKILDEDGLKYADIRIPYRHTFVNVNKIEASTYNLVGEKIIETKIKKSDIQDVRIDEWYNEFTLTMPNVKVGSIIEYRYIASSGSSILVDNMTLQSEIPTVYATVKSSIIELLSFNKNILGHHNVGHTHEKGKISLFIKSEEFNDSFTNTRITNDDTFVARDLPALVDQGYVWNLHSHISSVSYIPYRSDSERKDRDEKTTIYHWTWSEVDSEAMNWITEFRNPITPFDADVKIIKESDIPEIDKIAQIVGVIKKILIWNSEDYRITTYNPEEIIKKGMVSYSDVNLIAYHVLLTAGYDVKMVRVRSRDMPHPLGFVFSYTTASNVFIPLITIDNGEQILIDAVSNYLYPGILPPLLMVKNARLVDPNKDIWLDLSRLGNNTITESLMLNIDNSGNMTGQMNRQYRDVATYQAKTFLSAFRSLREYTDTLSNIYDIRIDKLTHEPIDSISPTYRETIVFTSDTESDGETIRFKPFLRAFHNREDFSYPTRNYPIEFDFPYILTYSAKITTPQGYTIDQLPENKMLIFDTNDSGDTEISFCRVNVVVDNDSIMIRYQFLLNTTEISHENYTQFREYFMELCNIYDQEIVLKRSQPL